MRHAPRSAGFTLLEVMTTVAIVSLVLVMVYSCWNAVLNAKESSSVAAQNNHREPDVAGVGRGVFRVAWYEHHASGPVHLIPPVLSASSRSSAACRRISGAPALARILAAH